MPGLGPVNLRRWVRNSESLEAAVSRAGKRWDPEGSLVRERLRQFDETLGQPNVWAMSWEAANYPKSWRELRDAPPVVFGRGVKFERGEGRPHVAIVGTRNCCADASAVAFELGKAVAMRDGVVVSGLARGVDASAHRGSCYAGGRSVGVLGGGLEPVSPVSSRPLATRMLRYGGAVVTERAVDEPVSAWHFAARNRLVVALSQALVLVQSPARGGALISAELALELGVDCWVYRPPQGFKGAKWAGNKKLLEQFPEMGWSDVEALANHVVGTKPRRILCAAERSIPTAFLSVWRALNVLGGGQLVPLAQSLHQPLEGVRSMLYTMEMHGWVQRMPGGWYVPLDP